MTGDQGDRRPLIVHVVYRFDTGGLENGVANLIDCLPHAHWRHAVVALTEVTAFRDRVRRKDVAYYELGKRAGHGFTVYPRMARLLRTLRPRIVHTRNLAALEMVVPAWAAGVPVRVHGEHGWDVGDLDGSNGRYRLMRRIYRPFVSRYVALSADIRRYLECRVGVDPSNVETICNGVDTERFRPADRPRPPIEGCPFEVDRHWLLGTIGRMQPVKNQVLLAKAFARAIDLEPRLRERARLVMVGEGPLLAEVRRTLDNVGLSGLAWLPGERSDIPDILRGIDCFALPSRAEGISNTILEAMSSALPVIATDVGGNSELVEPGRTGVLTPSEDVEGMAGAIIRYALDESLASGVGAAGRIRAERQFSLSRMVKVYDSMYKRLLKVGRESAMSASSA